MPPPHLELELNIALIPSKRLGQQLAAVSKLAAERYPAVVQLSDAANRRLAIAPHLTLLQLRLRLDDVTGAHQKLLELCRHYNTFRLDATTYSYNAEEYSLEVQYTLTQSLVDLQTDSIDQLNPLRGQLLLEYDPAGHDMQKLVKLPGQLGDAVRRTGYWEVGDPRQNGFFRPHATLNWFKPGTAIDLGAAWWPPVHEMSGAYDTLGIYMLGPYGTCPQLLAAYKLRGAKALLGLRPLDTKPD